MKKKKWIIIPIVIILLAVVLNNISYLVFELNPCKRIQLQSENLSVKIENMADVMNTFDYGLFDLIFDEHISPCRAFAVRLKPEDYVLVSVDVKLVNDTQMNLFDWDYCVKKGHTLCSVSIYEMDSPVFSPLLAGEETDYCVRFIAAKKDFTSANYSQELSAEILNNFSIDFRASDLNKSKTYKDLYGDNKK